MVSEQGATQCPQGPSGSVRRQLRGKGKKEYLLGALPLCWCYNLAGTERALSLYLHFVKTILVVVKNIRVLEKFFILKIILWFRILPQLHLSIYYCLDVTTLCS